MINRRIKRVLTNLHFWLGVSFLYLFIIIFFIVLGFVDTDNSYFRITEKIPRSLAEFISPKFPPLDRVDYDDRLLALANMPEIIKPVSTSSTSTSPVLPATTSTSTKKIYQTSWGKIKAVSPLWPVKTVYPKDGAILPFKRIIAYYGNFLSTGMGILGQYPEDVVLEKLKGEMEKWNLADPNTPTLPAIHYIAVTAQGSKGEDGKYRARMSDTQIEKALEMAKKVDGIVFLDIQVGQSTIQAELPFFEKYIKMPEVHIAVDPEFSMKNGRKPGVYVGTYDATEMNFVIDYLAEIVKKENLPPKIFVIHRYIQEMLTNANLIKTVPEVQVVIDMDGWGPPSNKLSSYKQFVYSEPVQFTGFKLFYKNDLRGGGKMMTPEEVLKLTPKPIYIQYQ